MKLRECELNKPPVAVMCLKGLVFTFISVLGVFAIVFAYWKYSGGRTGFSVIEDSPFLCEKLGFTKQEILEEVEKRKGKAEESTFISPVLKSASPKKVRNRTASSNGGTNISGTSKKVEECTVGTPLFKPELKMNGERMSVEKYYKIDAGQTIQIDIENTKENPVSCRSLLVEDGFSK